MSGNGNIIGAVVGAVIGWFVGGPAGALKGAMYGMAIGGVLMPNDLPPVSGPRLDDLRAQSSEYGRSIPMLYGTVGIAGNVIWSTDIVEVKTTTEVGGKGGGSQEVTEYTYFGNFAIALCDGPVMSVPRIWAGPEKRLIYDGYVLEGGTIRIYLGDEEQLPDPLIEQDKGVGNVPAYRGTCYVVFENFPLANDFNRLPVLTFEVSTGGTANFENYTEIEGKRLYDPAPSHVHTHTGQIMRGSAQDSDGTLYCTRIEDGSVYFDKIDLNGGLQDSINLGAGSSAIMALNPVARTAVVYQSGSSYHSIDLETFTASVTGTTGAFAKADVIYSAGWGGYVWLNYSNEMYLGEPHADNWGRVGAVAGGYLLDCDGIILAISSTQPVTYNGLPLTVQKPFDVFDPVARRAISMSTNCYLEFENFTLVEFDPIPGGVSQAVYNPYIRRIIGLSEGWMSMFNPATLSPEGFATEGVLFNSAILYNSDPDSDVKMHYALTPVVLPQNRSQMAFVDRIPGYATEGDIFVFDVARVGGGMGLSDVVADLCSRADLTSIDVTQLTDIVDGYAIAKQTDVRSAIDALRSAYYFDAVETPGADFQMIVRFVKRGAATVTTIDDDDLAAHTDGSDSGDPLRTVRIQEVELPRTVTVSYMQMATDYAIATKTAKRLIGHSDTQTTLEMPLVLSDTKAQEVAEVNLHAAWAQRLLYEFNIPSNKYCELEPTDLVLVKGNLMRLTKCTDTPFGVKKCQAVSDESSFYAPHVVVTETPPNDQEVYQPGETILFVM